MIMNDLFFKRREVKIQREHESLTDMMKRLYPNKTNSEATRQLAIDIYDGKDLRKKLKDADNMFNKLRRKNEKMF